MNFKPLKIIKSNGETLTFHPSAIIKISITQNVIGILQTEGKNLDVKQYILKADDYYYPEWNGFINKLNLIFEGVE